MQKEKKQKNNSTFGQRFRNLRKDMGLNQSELAEKLGFSANTIISRFEKNRSLPTIQTLLKLVEQSNADLHWLVTGKPAPSNQQLKETHKKALTKLANYVTWEISRLLEQRETIQSEMTELGQKQSKGEDVEQELIDLLEWQLSEVQRRLSKVAQDQPWVQEAIRIFDKESL